MMVTEGEKRYYRASKLIVGLMGGALRDILRRRWDERHESRLDKSWSNLGAISLEERGKLVYSGYEDILSYPNVTVAYKKDKTGNIQTSNDHIACTLLCSKDLDSLGGYPALDHFVKKGSIISVKPGGSSGSSGNMCKLELITKPKFDTYFKAYVLQVKLAPEETGDLVTRLPDLSSGGELRHHLDRKCFQIKDTKVESAIKRGDETQYDLTALRVVFLASSHGLIWDAGLKYGLPLTEDDAKRNSESEYSLIQAVIQQRNETYAHLCECSMTEETYTNCEAVCTRFIEHFFGSPGSEGRLQQFRNDLASIHKMDVADHFAVMEAVCKDIAACVDATAEEVKLNRGLYVEKFQLVQEQLASLAMELREGQAEILGGQAEIVAELREGQAELREGQSKIVQLLGTTRPRDWSRATRLEARNKNYIDGSAPDSTSVLEELMSKFGIASEECGAQDIHTNYCVVAGMGGVGKTSLALELAHIAKDQKKYDLVRFMCMQTEGDIGREWGAFATDLGLDIKDKALVEVIASVYTCLGTCRFLLIFDNADSFGMLQSSLREGSLHANQHTLITARDEAGNSSEDVTIWMPLPNGAQNHILLKPV